MPPLKTYRFANKYYSNSIIELQLWGDEDSAKDRLKLIVLDVKDWYLLNN